MEFQFKKKLRGNNVDIININTLFNTKNLDYQLQDLEVVVNYTISFDIKECGLTNLSINVTEIYLTADINIYKEELRANDIDLLKKFGFKEYTDDLTLFGWDLIIKNTNNNNFIVENSAIITTEITINEVEIYINRKGDNLSYNVVIN
jgi:hypothetical protein